MADTPLQRSTRDADWVRTRLTQWLATVLPEVAAPEVTLHAGAQWGCVSLLERMLDGVGA